MLRKLFLIVLSGILLFSFSGCSSKEEAVSDLSEENKPAVVALVNDSEIQREDFQSMVESMKLSYQQYGIDFESEEGKEILALLEAEALNNLIQQQLLLQDALKKNYEVSQDEVDFEIEQLKSQFDSEEDFSAALEISQLTIDLLEKSIADELILIQYVQNEIQEPTVSEEELMEIYEEYRQLMEDLPDFEELKFELEEEVKYRKFQVSFDALIEGLHAASNIEVFL